MSSYNFSHNLAEIARNGGFSLSDENDKSNKNIDWRFIAAVDTYQIIRESDFEKLDECIPFLIKSSISNLLCTRILDPAISKIYIVSQLSLQYLLFCTKFLDRSVLSLNESVFNYQKQNLELQEIIENRDKEIQNLRKRAKRYENISPILEIFPCTKCTKNFESEELLNGHMLRRHREFKDKDTNLISTIKLELEVKQLKERLNQTEKELMDVNAKIVECEKCNQTEQRTYKSVAIQSNFEEKEKDDREKEETAEKFKEFDENIRGFMTQQMKYFQQQKTIDEERHQTELSELKTLLDKTIEMMRQHEIKYDTLTTKTLVVSDESTNTTENDLIENLPQPQQDENLWEVRFKELEKMYENNQNQMAQSMKDIEKAYTEKMNKLEESFNKLNDERTKSVHQVELPPVKEIIPQVKIQQLFQRESSSEYSESEQVDDDSRNVSDPNLNKIEEKIPVEVKMKKPEKKIFGAQKFFIRKKAKKDQSNEESPEKVKVESSLKKKISSQMFISKKKENKTVEASKFSSRAIAENLCNDRMKEFGIPKHAKQLNQFDLDRINTKMANKREDAKKSFRGFFITRKKLKAKVDEIFGSRTSFFDDSDNNKILNSQKTTKEIKMKKEEVIPSNSNINPNFRSDLENILQKKLSVDQIQIDNDKPRKKVNFNLKEVDEIVNTNFIKVQNEDDSDFNITDFEQDL